MLLENRPNIPASIKNTATSGVKSSDRDFDIDVQKLERKKTAVANYQTKVLDFFADTRFSNAMLLWGDTERRHSLRLAQPSSNQICINYDDEKLKTSSDFGAVSAWLGKWSPIRKQTSLQECIKQIDAQLESEEKLTPLQAELLGVASQRYLPLIRVRDAKTENDSSEPAVDGRKEFELDFGKGEEPREGSKATSEEIWKAAAKRSIPRPKKLQTNGDLAGRMALAISGSEAIDKLDAVSADIDWPKRTPAIDFGPAGALTEVTINRFYTSIPVVLELKVVDKLDIVIDRGDLPNDIRVFLSDDPNETSSEDKLKHEVNEKDRKARFFINFFVANADAYAGQSFKLKLTANDRDNRSKDPDNQSKPCPPLEREFSALVSKDDALELSTIRDRVPDGQRPTTSLVRWEDSVEKNDQVRRPLAIRTMPNVKLPFAFSLQNNSSNPKSFHVWLFSIKKPKDYNVDEILADRISPEAASQYMNFLRKREELPGDSVFAGGEVLRPLAHATVKTVPGKTDQIEWNVILPPTGDSEAVEETAVDDEIKTGLLMIFWDQKSDVVAAADATVPPADTPDWYQFVEFQPASPINVNEIERNGAMLAGIKDAMPQRDKLQSSLRELKKNTLPKLKDVAAVRTLFSPSHPFGEANTLTLDELFQGTGFPATDEERGAATQLIDVLGLPGVAAFDGGPPNISAAREKATGVRIASIPEGFRSYPESGKWSFNPPSLRGVPNQELIEIYLDQGESEPGEVKLEFSLPLGEGEQAILKNSQDFWWQWNGGGEKLNFPISRKHHLSFDEGELKAWSETDRHHITKRVSNGNTLKLGRYGEEGEKETLGTWKFFTRAEGGSPRVTIKNKPAVPIRKKALSSALKNATITLDLSAIKPLPTPDTIKVEMGEADAKLNELLKKLKRTQKPSRKYKFRIAELKECLELELEEGKYIVSVTGQDFFAEPFEDSDGFSIKFLPPPKRPSPEDIQKAALKKPVPVKLTLTFNAGEKTIEDLREFTSISINGTTLPFGEKSNLGGDTVYVQRKKTTIVIHGLKQKKYKINVSATVKLEEANPAESTAEKTVTPGREDSTIECTLQ